jgi:RNA polymerase sigma-70 factor, ECF subfamily
MRVWPAAAYGLQHGNLPMKPADPPKPTGPTEQDPSSLIARALAGDPKAERSLYDNYVHRTYCLALRLTGDDELAEEATQQTFIRAFRWLHTFRGESSFTTWLHRITVNATLSELRGLQRRRRHEVALEAAGVVSSVRREGDPLLRQRMDDALASLPEIYRGALVMHDVEGFTHDQIGVALAIPVGTSKARLFRARARLRPLLETCALDYAS